MIRLLLTLLPAIALPTAVNAESHWLILTYGQGKSYTTAALEKIEMENAEACGKEGKRWKDSSTQESLELHRSFHCVVGK